MSPQPKLTFRLNRRTATVTAPPEKPLLWVLREDLGLTGTKYGCGVGVCGACTVHIDDRFERACMVPIGDVRGRRVATIEGLSSNGTHPVQKAWLDHGVSQCGYCQPGHIMTLAALLARRPPPTEAEIVEALSDHVCRCGTYVRMRAAIRDLLGRPK